MAGKQEAFSEDENRVLRTALRKLRADEGLSQAGVGRILGIKQQNAGRLLAADSRVGMGRGTANNLARHLGFRDAEHFLLEHGLLSTLDEVRPQERWSNRELAVRLAAKLGYDQAAVTAVVERFTSRDAMLRPAKWWLHKFDVEEREQAADRAPTLAPPTGSGPPPRRRRHAT